MFENELEATELCSDLFKFVAERDINSDTTNTPLKGIENYFDPEDNKFLSTTSDHIYDEGNNDDDVESKYILKPHKTPIMYLIFI